MVLINLLFLTTSMSLSNSNKKGYITKKKKKLKKSLFLPTRIHGSQTLLSHELTRNYNRNYSLYDRNYSFFEGEVNLTPFFARGSKRRLSWPKKRPMQPSRLFPDATQNQLYRRQKVTEELCTVTAVPEPKQLQQHQRHNTPILPLNGIFAYIPSPNYRW